MHLRFFPKSQPRVGVLRIRDAAALENFGTGIDDEAVKSRPKNRKEHHAEPEHLLQRVRVIKAEQEILHAHDGDSSPQHTKEQKDSRSGDQCCGNPIANHRNHPPTKKTTETAAARRYTRRAVPETIHSRLMYSYVSTAKTPVLLACAHVESAVGPRWLSLAGCPLHLVADALRLAEDAQQVAAEDSMDVFRAVTAVEQRLRDFRQVGGGIDALGSRAADAVEIGAEADVIDA